MPNIIDATVVNSAYQTSASARPQRLSNGWLICAVYNPTDNKTYICKSIDNGDSFSILTTTYAYPNASISICSNGTMVYMITVQSTGTQMHFHKFDALTVAPTIVAISIIDMQTSYGNCSLAINEQGTELHACWSSKNSTYPNSFNIRYTKGIINSDGSVTWGSVEQITTLNSSGVDAKNPTIVIKDDGKPLIVMNILNGNYYIHTWYKDSVNAWQPKTIYNIASYVQSSPSAIYVPPSINGLSNGRIWVAWKGVDSTENVAYNLRVSYSDDGGISWSSVEKLTTGNTYHRALEPSLTSNSKGDIFIVFYGYTADSITNTQLLKIKHSNGSWGSLVKMSSFTTNADRYPSTLFDTSFNFSEPLFIYKDSQNSKVGFYGSWLTPPSIPKGSNLGKKLSNFNIYLYTVTQGEGTITSLVEKIDGTIINTYTNQTDLNRIMNTTVDQWYSLSNGNHVLTIETTDSNGYTISENYPFEKVKQIPLNSKIKDITSELQDIQMLNGKAEVTNVLGSPFNTEDSPITMVNKIQAIKNNMASSLTNKGVSSLGTEALEELASKFIGFNGKRWAKGEIVVSEAGKILVTGVLFKPSIIILDYFFSNLGAIRQSYRADKFFEGTYSGTTRTSNDLVSNIGSSGWGTMPLSNTNSSNGTFTCNNGSFTAILPGTTVPTVGTKVYWVAIE